MNRSLRFAVAALAAVSAAGLTLAASAGAQSSGSATLTITVEPPLVRSVTVSPSTATYDECWTKLGSVGRAVVSPPKLVFPNGFCFRNEPIEVRIGPALSVLVGSTSKMTSTVPPDWNPVLTAPGAVDEFRAWVSVTYPNNWVPLSLVATRLFDYPVYNNQFFFYPKLLGPSQATSPGTSWSHTITFSVFPPP